MVELQTCLHAVIILELKKCETAAFATVAFFRSNPHGHGIDLAEMIFHRLLGCRKWKISCEIVPISDM
jgi:hypothetical protein